MKTEKIKYGYWERKMNTVDKILNECFREEEQNGYKNCEDICKKHFAKISRLTRNAKKARAAK